MTATSVPATPELEYMTSTETTITVAWTAPASFIGLTGYVLYVNDEVAYDGTGNVALQSFTLVGCETTQVYDFTIKAMSEAGESANSTILTRICARRPYQMDAPALRSSSPEHVEIEWAPPRLTGGMPISGYKVQRAEAGQLDFKDMHPGVIIPPENHTYKDVAVRPIEPYKYRVLAINGIDDVNFQDVSGYSTFQAVGVSDPPENITRRGAELATAIFVDWSAVRSQQWGGNLALVLAYRLYGNDGLDGPMELVFDGTGSPSTRYYNHTGLVPGRRYRYAVTVVNIAGEGPMSPYRSFLAAVPPTAPSKPELIVSDATTLDVQWSPPVSLGGGIISKYVVWHDNGEEEQPTPHIWIEVC
jgi:hypothetical protein